MTQLLKTLKLDEDKFKAREIWDLDKRVLHPDADLQFLTLCDTKGKSLEQYGEGYILKVGDVLVTCVTENRLIKSPADAYMVIIFEESEFYAPSWAGFGDIGAMAVCEKMDDNEITQGLRDVMEAAELMVFDALYA